MQRGATNRDHLRRLGRILGRRAGITRGDEEAHPRLNEVAVEGRLAAELAPAPTVGHVLGVRLGVVLAGQQVAEAARPRLDQQDLRPRGDRVRPLDVEADLERPAGIRGRVAGAAGLVHLLEATAGRRARGQAVLAAERGQVGLGRWIVVGIDDRDRLAGPRRQRGGETVGQLDHRGREPLRGDGSVAVDAERMMGVVLSRPRRSRQWRRQRNQRKPHDHHAACSKLRHVRSSPLRSPPPGLPRRRLAGSGNRTHPADG